MVQLKQISLSTPFNDPNLSPCLHLNALSVHEVKERIYNVLSGEDSLVCMDSCLCDSSYYPRSVEFLAGWGGTVVKPGSLEELYQSWKEHSTWHLGILSYDVKNQLERLTSLNQPIIDLPDMSFLIPENVLIIDSENRVWSNNPHLEEVILAAEPPHSVPNPNVSISWDRNREEYLRSVDSVRTNILEGEIYEMNLCVSATVKGEVYPFAIYRRLIDSSPTPFAGYLSLEKKHAISASPERYMSKHGKKLMSQPIKGTTPRHSDPISDLANREALLSSEKDRSENIMIVDLVRNDLARCCSAGSVQVDELFGIYSFSNVHQMISSVSGTLEKNLTWVDVIRSSFPMGSMTGAPKIRSMELIEEFERFKRQWYSGALGYITPSGDFDFNVMIRSLFYDSQKHLGYWGVGGAITYDSNPESEWDEVHVKAKALKEILGVNSDII